jgi:hypothetical protein
MLNQLPPNIFEFIRGGQRLRTGRIMATFADDAMVSDNHREFRGGTDDHWLCCLVTSVAYCHSSSAIAVSKTSGEASATMGLPRRWWNLPGVM